MVQSVATVISRIRIEAIDYANWPSEQSLHYPGPRGFLLHFLGKFCGLRQVIMPTGHQNKAFITRSQRLSFILSFQIKKEDNIKRKASGTGYAFIGGVIICYSSSRNLSCHNGKKDCVTSPKSVWVAMRLVQSLNSPFLPAPYRD